MPQSIRNMKLVGVGSELQLGKGGVILRSVNGVLKTVNQGGSLARLQAAPPTNPEDAVTKQFYDDNAVRFYGSTGSLIPGVKAVTLNATTDATGNWSAALPNLGQTSITISQPRQFP